MKLDRNDQFELVRGFLVNGEKVRKQAFGDSMLPSIPDGAFLQIEPLMSDQVRRGDVVLFGTDQGHILIHRVARLFRRRGQFFIQAWGDNNLKPDSPVPSEQLFGRVVSLKIDGEWQAIERGLCCYLKHFVVRYCGYFANRLSVKLVCALFPSFLLKFIKKFDLASPKS